MTDKIAVITLNYTDVAVGDTLDCLDSLQKAALPPETVVYLVAMETSQKEEARLKSHVLKPVVIPEKNLGFTGGNNRGIREAIGGGAEVLIILNNDTLVTKSFLRPLLDGLKDPTVGVVVPKIYFAPGYEFHKGSYAKAELGKVIWYAGGIIDWQNVYGSHRGVDEVDHGQFDKPEETDFATGCCIAMRANLIKKIGAFDNKYFLYYEDIDLSQRVKKAGFSIYFEPKSVIYHKNAGSTKGSGSTLHTYYQTRNRFLFAMRYASWRTKAAIIKEGIRMLFGGKAAEKTAISDALKGRYGKKQG